MNETELPVRIADPCKKIFRAVQTELDPILLKPVKVVQRLLKIWHLPLSAPV
jgi:hypothetical protein